LRTYGQFCPIARGSEILAERWTPIILRNLLLGCRTFNEIAAGAPGLSRALLARRLRELERAGVLEIRPKPGGRGSVYEPTPAGKDLAGCWRPSAAGPSAGRICAASTPTPTSCCGPGPGRSSAATCSPTGGWWSGSSSPARAGGCGSGWWSREGTSRSAASTRGSDDVVVAIDDPLAFARWHLGRVEWAAALRAGGITVSGPRALRQALPTWNVGPEGHAAMRAERGLPV
jgi:DNA-binding HxlR family transcriptional regulator